MGSRSQYFLFRLNRILKNHSVKCFAYLAADMLRIRHLSVRIDTTSGCNICCQMCHYSAPENRGKPSEFMSVKDYELIASRMYPKAIQVYLGAGSEPTIHPDLPYFVEIAKKKYRVPYVGISTHGQLLTETLIDRLIQSGMDEFVISVHGVNKDTYERLQPPAKFELLHENLRNLHTKITVSNRKPQLRINYTINPSNFRDLVDFFKVFGGYRISTLQFRKMYKLGKTDYRDCDLKPYRQELAEIHKKIGLECKKRNIVFLCHSFESDPSDELPPSVLLLPLVYRHVTPSMVWKDDYKWREESYEAYCKRTHWYREIIRMAFTPSRLLIPSIPQANRSLGWDVK